jgi:AcrR family transcriptional regulator
MASEHSNTRQTLVRAEIVEVAAQVFAELGFRKATLDDIAGRLGISRATLYHYVEGKEDLLHQVIGNVSERHALLLDEVLARPGLTPSARLAEAIRTLVQVFGSNADVMRVFLREESELPAELLTEHRHWKAKSDEAMRRIVSAGIEAGEFRPNDPKLASFAIFGMVNWLHVWYRPGGDASLEEIGDAFVEFALGGLMDGEAPTSERSLEGTVSQLRATVEELGAQVLKLREQQRREAGAARVGPSA